MPILTGKRLGPYEILSAIGVGWVGGMGEVYRAKDTRLDRFVAIKVLPSHLADSSELRERFEREARTIASLNHPHICTLYDIGHQDGTDFLVMEYLEGETLAQRLVKGPLPLDQVLRYAIEIADALDKAHRKGVTHRDLKPGNIMLSKSGTKLLDFGLAKLRQNVAPATPSSQLDTVQGPVTAQGTILGTLQYMAPEQVEWGDVDARTDIFAFGAAGYEMATGKRAFDGKSQASLIAAILEREPPPMSTLQPMTPPALDRVVKTCLAKDRDEQWQSASDLHRELKWTAETGVQSAASRGATTTTGARRSPRRWLLPAAISCLFWQSLRGLRLATCCAHLLIVHPRTTHVNKRPLPEMRGKPPVAQRPLYKSHSTGVIADTCTMPPVPRQMELWLHFVIRRLLGLWNLVGRLCLGTTAPPNGVVATCSPLLLSGNEEILRCRIGKKRSALLFSLSRERNREQ